MALTVGDGHPPSALPASLTRPGRCPPPNGPTLPPRWFCHVDDDNYVNPAALLQLLAAFAPSQDVYLGRPSLDHPIEATERVPGSSSVSPRKMLWAGPVTTTLLGLGSKGPLLSPALLQVTTAKFWFATGGAGFCLSRGLALKMSPWAR